MRRWPSAGFADAIWPAKSRDHNQAQDKRQGYRLKGVRSVTVGQPNRDLSMPRKTCVRQNLMRPVNASLSITQSPINEYSG